MHVTVELVKLQLRPWSGRSDTVPLRVVIERRIDFSSKPNRGRIGTFIFGYLAQPRLYVAHTDVSIMLSLSKKRLKALQDDEEEYQRLWNLGWEDIEA